MLNSAGWNLLVASSGSVCSSCMPPFTCSMHVQLCLFVLCMSASGVGCDHVCTCSLNYYMVCAALLLIPYTHLHKSGVFSFVHCLLFMCPLACRALWPPNTRASDQGQTHPQLCSEWSARQLCCRECLGQGILKLLQPLITLYVCGACAVYSVFSQIICTETTI